jgi:hypothetical protein
MGFRTGCFERENTSTMMMMMMMMMMVLCSPVRIGFVEFRRS